MGIRRFSRREILCSHGIAVRSYERENTIPGLLDDLTKGPG